jgi:hypothetical protein
MNHAGCICVTNFMNSRGSVENATMRMRTIKRIGPSHLIIPADTDAAI